MGSQKLTWCVGSWCGKGVGEGPRGKKEPKTESWLDPMLEMGREVPQKEGGEPKKENGVARKAENRKKKKKNQRKKVGLMQPPKEKRRGEVAAKTLGTEPKNGGKKGRYLRNAGDLQTFVGFSGKFPIRQQKRGGEHRATKGRRKEGEEKKFSCTAESGCAHAWGKKIQRKCHPQKRWLNKGGGTAKVPKRRRGHARSDR